MTLHLGWQAVAVYKWSYGRHLPPDWSVSRIANLIKPGIQNMKSLQENMIEYKKQLAKGVIQKAYRGLMEYMMSLKNHFADKYPDFLVPGSIYYGYMDMTYFSILPKSLKDRDLKIAVVFLYDTFRFEVWLSGKNKQVLSKYWKVLKKGNWGKYKIVEPVKGVDSIAEYILVDDPDFNDMDDLTKQIDKGTLEFIKDVESFLNKTAI
jgi:hypothetical protein